jgi:ubiquinone biosynthesis protein COQ9
MADNPDDAAHVPDMDDDVFDRALIAAWFALLAGSGRRFPSVAAAAREAGLPVERARARFASRASVLLRFGRLADQAALTGMATDGSGRARLFDTVMRRIDQLQAHRAGVLAALRLLPTTPPLALLLGLAMERSVRWLLDAAGVSTGGLRGALRVRGMVGVWVWTVRAWQTDDSADLSTTMAALDKALGHAERAAGWLGGGAAAASPEVPADPPMAAPADVPMETPDSAGDSVFQPGLEPPL